MALRLGGKEKITRQHSAGRLTVEKISYLWIKVVLMGVGVLAGKSSYDDDGNLKSIIPANSVIGHG